MTTSLRLSLLTRTAHDQLKFSRTFSALATSKCLTTSSHPIVIEPRNRRLFSDLSTAGQSYVDFSSDLFLKLANLPPTVFAQDTLCYFHDTLGLSWWSCIAMSTLVLRFGTMLPAQIIAQKTVAKRVLLKDEMDQDLIPKLRAITDQNVKKNGWSQTTAKDHFQRISQQIYRAKVVEYNCASSKIFLPILFQIPIWIFTTAAIRNLAYQRTDPGSIESLQRIQELSSEGCLWFPNLITPDTSLVLPVLVGAAFVLGTEISSLQFYDKNLPDSVKAKHLAIRNTLWRLTALAMAFVAAQNPSAVAFYWMTSGSSAVVMNLLMMSPKFRRIVRIPLIKSEEQNPYKKLVYHFRLRFKIFSSKFTKNK